MTDQNQETFRIYPVRQRGKGILDQLAEYRTSLEAAIKQRDELAAALEAAEKRADVLLAENIAVHERAKKAEAERDQAREACDDLLNVLPKLMKAEAERDQALAASAAREIAMRDRAIQAANDWYFNREPDDVSDAIHDVPLSPDGQQALDEMLAKAWEDGWLHAKNGGLGPNPYRKGST